MKIQSLFLCLVGTLILLSACQKEKSFESGTSPSAGLLQSDVSGDCLPKTINGVYEEGKVLVADSNTMDVTVIVTQAGSYTIYTRYGKWVLLQGNRKPFRALAPRQ
jgi:hypothetical protein